MKIEMEVWYLKWAWVNFEETEKLPDGWITFPKHVPKTQKRGMFHLVKYQGVFSWNAIYIKGICGFPKFQA